MLYVDKTDMMYDLVSKYKYVFLSRPRRFGKSLLCNTFKAYFQGQKELFEACPEQGRKGLKVMEQEKEWKRFPVLHFDMSIMRNCSNLDGYREALADMLAKYEKQYGAVKEAEEFGTRFHQLLRHIYETQHKRVVVVIDEYDTPMMRNLYNEELLEYFRESVRNECDDVININVISAIDQELRFDEYFKALEQANDDEPVFIPEIDDSKKYDYLKENPVKKAGSIGEEASNKVDFWTVDEFEKFKEAFTEDEE